MYTDILQLTIFLKLFKQSMDTVARQQACLATIAMVSKSYLGVKVVVKQQFCC